MRSLKCFVTLVVLMVGLSDAAKSKFKLIHSRYKTLQVYEKTAKAVLIKADPMTSEQVAVADQKEAHDSKAKRSCFHYCYSRVCPSYRVCNQYIICRRQRRVCVQTTRCLPYRSCRRMPWGRPRCSKHLRCHRFPACFTLPRQCYRARSCHIIKHCSHHTHCCFG